MRVLEVEKGIFECDDAPKNDSIVEVRLLLESGLLNALESAANRQGQSAARLLRSLIHDYLRESGSRPTAF